MNKPVALARQVGWIALVAASCASSGNSSAEDYRNPEECLEVVEAHRANPNVDVEEVARPKTIRIPPGGSSRNRVQLRVTVLVNEDGSVAKDLVEVEGDAPRSVLRAAQDLAEGWTFRPAYASGCWVPSTYTYDISLGR